MEHALYLGISYSGNMYNTYINFIAKYYPNSYLYERDSKVLHHWGDTVKATDIIQKNDSILVYFDRDNLQTQESILNDFSILNNTRIASFKKIFTNQATNEDIYLIQQGEALPVKLLSYESIRH
jgi:hypothetical protein